MLKYLTVKALSLRCGLVEELIEYLKGLEKAVLAFSGGVDSSLLAYLLKRADVDFEAVMVVTEFISERRVSEATKISRKIGFNLKILRRKASEEMLKNDELRCYYCKKMIFSEISELYPDKPILDGTNYSDIGKERPGMRALEEFGVLSPLAIFKLRKEDVRAIARSFGLDFYNKPSDSCLATRIYGKITKEKLEFVDTAERVAERIITGKVEKLRVRVGRGFEIFLWFGCINNRSTTSNALSPGIMHNTNGNRRGETCQGHQKY